MNFNQRNLVSRIKNFFNLYSYLQHPKLNLRTPRDIRTNKDKFNLLLTMRDLRFWMLENVPHSSRHMKLSIEVEKINRELHYMQFRALLRRSIIVLGGIFMLHLFGPQYLSGSMGIYDRPIISQGTGGTSIFKEGGLPKYNSTDMADLIGF